MAVVNHRAGSSVREEEEELQDDDALLSQLGASKRRSNVNTSAHKKEAQAAKKPAGFNSFSRRACSAQTLISMRYAGREEIEQIVHIERLGQYGHVEMFGALQFIRIARHQHQLL